jgi:hypothetical protein
VSYNIWFDVPLICLKCGSEIRGLDTGLHSPGLNADMVDSTARPGDVLPIYESDFDDAYFRLHDPGEDGEIAALEQWRCPVSDTVQWARLEFRREAEDRFRFVSAQSVPLTPDVVCGMHVLSRSLDSWLQANPGDESDQLLKIIAPALP